MRMNSFEEKLMAMVDLIKVALGEVVQSATNKDPSQQVFPSELLPKLVQTNLKTNKDVIRIGHQLSRLLLTQAISVTRCLVWPTKVSATATVRTV